MQRTKTFTQYSESSFSIRLLIDIDGNPLKKYSINYFSEKRKKNIIQWRKNNPNKTKKYNKKWVKNNFDKIKIYRKQWCRNNPDKVKLIKQKTKAKRRNYGFNPLNDYFEGSHFHHLHIDNNEDGIFMPGYIHDSIWHDPNNKESMIKINKLAFEWLERQ